MCWSCDLIVRLFHPSPLALGLNGTVYLFIYKWWTQIVKHRPWGVRKCFSKFLSLPSARGGRATLKTRNTIFRSTFGDCVDVDVRELPRKMQIEIMLIVRATANVKQREEECEQNGNISILRRSHYMFGRRRRRRRSKNNKVNFGFSSNSIKWKKRK